MLWRDRGQGAEKLVQQHWSSPGFFANGSLDFTVLAAARDAAANEGVVVPHIPG